MSTAKRFVLAALCLSQAGCIAFQKPENPYDVGGGQGYMAERRDMPSEPHGDAAEAKVLNLSRCTAPARPAVALAPVPEATTSAPLSPGDLVRVNVTGDEPPTGTYKVGTDGSLNLLQVGLLPVAGLTTAEAEGDLNRLLVSRQIFKRGFAHASIRVLDRGAARVVVTGAVFLPGVVTINQRAPNDSDTVRETAIGDHAIGRSLSVALSNANGVRPDADLEDIVVQHGDQRRTYDISGLLNGGAAVDPTLQDGDRVVVPSRHCFQPELVQPSPITPPGVKVFVSNLTVPAQNNAASANVGQAQAIPYGTRFLQGLIIANCVGGTQFTNADRWGVLISKNPLTGDSEVIERRIEALVRRKDRDAYNPPLMPNDAIACYDSNITNVRDVLRSFGDIGFTTAAVRGIGGF